MKNKLVQLLKKITAKYHHSCWANTDKIADYLLDHNTICLPFKVGDTVFSVVTLVSGKKVVIEGTIFEFTITHEYNKIVSRFYFACDDRNYNLWYELDDFGKKVFATKHEAYNTLLETPYIEEESNEQNKD